MTKRSCLLFFTVACLLLPLTGSAQTDIKTLSLKDDIINPATADYIKRGLELAEKDDSILILILDTPGGLLQSTQKIVKLILNSSVPVVTYISPKGAKAASAGVFIGYASHILAMAPSTHIGAAHPVLAGGGNWGNVDPEMQKKILNDTLAWAKNIAQTRGRPIGFIEDAIEKSISITEAEALKKKIIDLTAGNLDELINKLNNRTVETAKGKVTLNTIGIKTQELPLTKREKFLNTIINPNIAYLLMTLGFLALIFEVTHPGFGFSGITGMICLILAFYAFSVLPVNYAGIALIVLGITFFVVEAFTPTFGMFTLGGVIAFGLGSVMLFNQAPAFKISLGYILPLVIAFALFSLFILSKAIATMRQRPRVGSSALIGKEANALTNIGPKKKGKIFLDGAIWTAIAEEKISKGDNVIVTKVVGLKLYVRKP